MNTAEPSSTLGSTPRHGQKATKSGLRADKVKSQPKPRLQVAWAPQPGPQTHAIDAHWCPELLYGGAKGGGKTDFLLGDFLIDVPTYGEHWQGILFRRTYKELEEVLKRSHQIFPQTGATWEASKGQWRWSNGAVLKLRHLDNLADAQLYQGHSYTWIGFDELGNWPNDEPYKYMMGCLRSAFPVPTKRIRASANPGGAGHNWVKGRFIVSAPAGYTPLQDEDTGLPIMFIPARLENNKILMRNDPAYEARLHGIGSKELVKALRYGDWNVIAGAFFDWSSEKHTIKPFSIPSHWLRFRSFDWGSAKPFSVGWYAVASETIQVHGQIIPRECLIRYREWYGCGPKPNTGIKLTAEEVAEGIRDFEKGDKITYGVADPSIFIENGGPSIAERMMRAAGIHWRAADNKRIAGWDMMRARFRGSEDGSMFRAFDSCAHFIRTVPVLQHDQSNAEDVDTTGEDHAGDEGRYAFTSRPWVGEALTQMKKRRDSAYNFEPEETENWKTI